MIFNRKMNKQQAEQKNQKNNAEPELNKPEGDYQKLQSEFAEYKDKYVRLFAEFENARKRNERERGEFVKYANEGLIAEFLGIIDDLERTVHAAKANQQDQDVLLKGIEMVLARMKDLLKRNDVRPLKAVGEKFDPHRHEILMLVDSDEHDEGMVIEEFQKGYLLGDKVVRTAKVKVTKPKPSASQAASETEQAEQSPAPETQDQPPQPD